MTKKWMIFNGCSCSRLAFITSITLLCAWIASPVRSEDTQPIRLSIYAEPGEEIELCPIRAVLALDRRVEGKRLSIKSKALSKVECDNVRITEVWVRLKRSGPAEWEAKLSARAWLQQGRDKWVTLRMRFLRAGQPISGNATVVVEGDEGETMFSSEDTVRISTFDLDGSIALEASVEVEPR